MKNGDLTAEEISKVNIEALAVYNTQGLVQCPGCSKSFEADAFEKHIKSCKSGQKA